MDRQFLTSVKSCYLWIDSDYSLLRWQTQFMIWWVLRSRPGSRVRMWSASSATWTPTRMVSSASRQGRILVFHYGKLLKSKAYFLKFYVHTKYKSLLQGVHHILHQQQQCHQQPRRVTLSEAFPEICFDVNVTYWYEFEDNENLMFYSTTW